MTIQRYSVNKVDAKPESLKKINEYCDVRKGYLYDPDNKYTEGGISHTQAKIFLKHNTATITLHNLSQ